MPSRTRAPRARRAYWWAKLSDEELLDVRFCDLGLSLEGSPLAPLVERLYDDLDGRGIQFRPHCWLGEEWFTPDGVPGFAVPFYLAHPRLKRLERRILGEVEGGNRNWMLRILRHEAGHALDNAYRLRRRRVWRETFGPASLPYPDSYRPRPASRRYVQLPRQLVCTKSPDRGLRRNLRRLAATGLALALALRRLAGAGQARVRRPHDACDPR